MARTGWGRHTVVATGTNDNSKQISVNAWNNDLDTDGILGFTPETVASASSVTPTNSFVKLSGSTSVDTIALGNSADGDLLYLITTGSVTLNNTSSPSSNGDIRLLSNANKDLSTTVPTILIRNGNYWYEYGGASVGDGEITFAKIQDIASMKVIGRTAGSSGVSSEVAFLDEDNMASNSATSLATQQSIKAYVDGAVSSVTPSSTTTFTNKTIDADATGNSITNIENANIKASAGIDATKLADGTVTSTELQYINTLSSNAQTQLDAKLTASSTNTLTNKTLDADGTGNSITNIEDANIKASAAIDATKIANGTVTSAEFQYLGDVTSLIQAQLDAKQTTTLTGANLLVGNGSNVATSVTLSGDATLSNAGALTLDSDVRAIGVQDMAVPASAMWGTGTNGADGLTSVEAAENQPTYQVWEFDQSTEQHVQFCVPMPRNYNNGTITATIYWTAASSSGDVVWGISGRAFSNDDAIAQALGTVVEVTDTLTATNDVCVSSATGAITLAGSPADADMWQIQVDRVAADGSDTLGADARLFSIVIHYTTDSAVAG